MRKTFLGLVLAALTLLAPLAAPAQAWNGYYGGYSGRGTIIDRLVGNGGYGGWGGYHCGGGYGGGYGRCGGGYAGYGGGYGGCHNWGNYGAYSGGYRPWNLASYYPGNSYYGHHHKHHKHGPWATGYNGWARRWF